MSADRKDRYVANLKEAASLLTRGGTLINDPCDLCNGVQVKYRDKIICINCGNQKIVYSKSNTTQQKIGESQQVNIQKDSQIVADVASSPPPTEYSETHTQQDVHGSEKGLEMEAARRERKEGQCAFPQDRESRDPWSLQHVGFLLIDKIVAEIAKIKEEDNPELLRRKAETIRIFLGLLQKVKEIQRL
ncbi:MAG TPA: Sjogren's syndrome/scleroderma autoantigen 1 family protein [Nitrososphaeraceae archaeon]|nr:Sjogren's syndrome/scleroderma autoantigen 1 family protein [Nitrososphaeraceae archaeon]